VGCQQLEQGLGKIAGTSKHKPGDNRPCLTNPAPQGLAGTFKILRGSDECGIEDGVVAGMVV
jgi:hypothetical protein